MKKLIMSFMALTAFTAATAQIEKGTVLMGGNSAFSYSSTSYSGGGTSNSITQLNLRTGYFLAENFTLGANIGYTSFSSGSLTTIGAFARYYPQGKFFLGVGYSSLSTSGGGASQGLFNAELGYAAFVGRSVAFEPAIEFGSGDGFTILGFGLGINVYLGRGDGD